jgi:predicted GNAT superfamily acetyltransferase
MGHAISRCRARRQGVASGHMTDHDSIVAGAHTLAREMAVRAGVEVAELHDPADLAAAARLFKQIWAGASPMVAPELFAAHDGPDTCLTGAFDKDGTMLGACAAFVAHDPAHGMRFLDSHVTAARDGVSAGVGTALKTHQRAWSIQREIEEIRWNFDPLVRRNAWFNLGRLGARATGFVPDMYGRRDDALSLGLATHRLTVSWGLQTPRVVRALSQGPAAPNVAALARSGAAVILDVAADNTPIAAETNAERRLVRIPDDIIALRRTDIVKATAWSDAIAATLGASVLEGFAISGVTRDGWYALVQDRERNLAASVAPTDR